MLVSMVIVTPHSGVQSSEEVAKKIETEISGVSALTDAERGETVEPILNEIALWNLGIKSMLFLMSMLLVTTVTMMNVSEKRRDFATFHAIGAPATSVFRTVLIETTLLGFFGGVIGVFLGVLSTILLVSAYAGISLSLLIGDAFVLVPPLLMVETLVSAVLVSGVSGIIPAIAAARTNIAEVLRAEY
jgi:putative ABC transport system permease protein